MLLLFCTSCLFWLPWFEHHKILLYACLPIYKPNQPSTISTACGPSGQANIAQLVKKFPAFNGTFIRCSLSWVNWMQSTLFHPVPLQATWITFSHLRLGLPSGLFHSGIPTTTVFAFLFSLIYVRCSTILILIDLINLITFVKWVQIMKFLVCSFLPLRSKYYFQQPVLGHPLLSLSDQVSEP